MKQAVVILLVAGISSFAQAQEKNCTVEEGKSHAVWDKPQEIRQFTQAEAVPVSKKLTLSEVQLLIPLKGWQLDADVTVPAPFAVTIPGGTDLRFWRDQKGEKLCALRLEKSFLRGQQVKWLCFSDKNGDGAYETAYGPSASKAQNGEGYPEVSLPEPLRLSPIAIDKRTDTYMPPVFGKRLAVAKVRGNKVTLEVQTGMGGYNKTPADAFVAYFDTAETREVDVAATPVVEIAGQTVTFDASDPKAVKVSLTAGQLALTPKFQCDNTIASIHSPREFMTLVRSFD